MKQFLYIFLLSFIATHLSAESTWTGSAKKWTKGDGTASSPYLIETADQLAYLSELGGTGYFELRNDLNLNNGPWVPIKSFSGTFDGKNHIIRGLNTALFDICYRATITNVILNVKINSKPTFFTQLEQKKSHIYLGALVNQATECTIKHCLTKGEIGFNYRNGYTPDVAAFVGYASNCTISQCINKAHLYCKPSNLVCGIVAKCESNVNVVACANQGKINPRAEQPEGPVNMAFAIGYGGSSGISVQYCYNTDTVKSYYKHDGGLINSGGYFGGGDFSTQNCYSRKIKDSNGDPVFNTSERGGYKNCYAESSRESEHTKTTAIMKSDVFVDILNNGTTYFAPDIPLTINEGYPILSFQIDTIVIKQTIKRGNSATFNGKKYTEPGEYSYYEKNDTWGATIRILKLTVQEVPINVTLSVNNEVMGYVTGGGEHLSNEQIEINAIPNYGYHFVSWNDGVTSAKRSIKLGLKDTSFVANFAVNQYEVKVQTNDVALGSVTGNGKYDYKSIVTITATPQAHCHFVKWKDGSITNPRIIELVSDTTISAIFAKDQFTLTVLSNDEIAGSVSGSGIYDYYSVVEIKATANTGYEFKGWSDGVNASTRNILINQDSTLTAIFEQCHYSVSVTSNDITKGMVYGGGTFTYGQSTNIAAVANSGYKFVKWSDDNTAMTRSIVVTSDVSLMGYFEEITFVIDAKSNDEKMGIVIGGGIYQQGTNVTLIAIENEHYHFVKWNDGVTTASRIITVTENASYTAMFAIDQFIISVVAENGSVTGSGTYDYGTEVTLTAIPNDDYEFVNWSNGITENPYSFIVEQDVNLTANFKKVDTGWQDVFSGIKTAKHLENSSIIIERGDNHYSIMGQKIR